MRKFMQIQKWRWNRNKKYWIVW